MLSASLLSAQAILSNKDSIPVTKPKVLQSRYMVNYPPLGEIRLVNREIRAIELARENFWDRLTAGTLTLLSGLQTSSSSMGFWVSENELISSDPTLSWQVFVFMQGEEFKNRERIRNSDGSTSVDTQKGVWLDWSNGAFGLLLEGSDTLGQFSLYLNK